MPIHYICVPVLLFDNNNFLYYKKNHLSILVFFISEYHLASLGLSSLFIYDLYYPTIPTGLITQYQHIHTHVYIYMYIYI